MSLPFNLAFSGISSGLQTKNATAGGGGVGGWVELGRTTLGSAASTITVSSLANKRYLMMLVNTSHSVDSAQDLIRVGNGSIDSGSNYSNRYQINGGADGTSVSDTEMYPFQTQTLANQSEFGISYFSNYSTKEKLVIHNTVHGSTIGAGTAPARREMVSKWANTSNVIDTVRSIVSDGNLTSGSEVVVLGWDPADTHTNNFWTELASVNWSSGATIDSGVFTAKKYLWIQAYLDSDTTAGYDRIRVGNATIDTAANYSGRYSIDGGADGTQVSSADNFFPSDGGGSVSRKTFTNIFVVNNSANEKLFIGSSIFYYTAGAGTAPKRTEWVMKWANTSNQINRVDFNRSAGNYEGSTTLRVWGSN